ncbi:MAG: hypothetical protein U0176_02965 [Bacteroidia bacterium]
MGTFALWTTLAGQAPYRCGFVLESAEAIREVYSPELEILNLQAGDVIADVGGSNGYRMAMFAVLYDSLTFYVQDIDSLCLNEEEWAAVRTYHEGLKGRSLACDFHLVLGEPRASHLPEGAIDKLLVTASYHHFGDPQGMLADLRTKLRPGGRIYLIENVVRKAGKRRRKLCNDPLQTAEGLQQDFERQGFKVASVHSLGRWWTKLFVLEP